MQTNTISHWTNTVFKVATGQIYTSGWSEGGVVKDYVANDMLESISQQHDNFSKQLQDKLMLLGGVNGGLGKDYVANDMLDSVSSSKITLEMPLILANSLLE